MIELKSSTIISSITRKLKDNFNDCQIYKDKKLQGLKKPCFFVFNLNSFQNRSSKDIFTKEHLINIRFHSDFNRAEIDETAFELLDILSEIKNDELILRPIREITYEIQDNVLQMFIPYKLRVFKESEKGIDMNEVNINGGVK